MNSSTIHTFIPFVCPPDVDTREVGSDILYAVQNAASAALDRQQAHLGSFSITPYGPKVTKKLARLFSVPAGSMKAPPSGCVHAHYRVRDRETATAIGNAIPMYLASLRGDVQRLLPEGVSMIDPPAEVETKIFRLYLDEYKPE